jgi:hypothetical protein
VNPASTACWSARQALAAEAGRVVHPGESRVEPGPQEIQPVRGGGVVLREEVADLAAQVIGGDAAAGAAAVARGGQHSGPPAT